jgi:hypothetical protein
MIIPLEAGDLRACTDGDRVNLIAHHVVEGEDGQRKMVNVCLSLSPLAAHNLAAILPHLEEAASSVTIGNIMAQMGRGDAKPLGPNE